MNVRQKCQAIGQFSDKHILPLKRGGRAVRKVRYEGEMPHPHPHPQVLCKRRELRGTVRASKVVVPGELEITDSCFSVFPTGLWLASRRLENGSTALARNMQILKETSSYSPILTPYFFVSDELSWNGCERLRSMVMGMAWKWEAKRVKAEASTANKSRMPRTCTFTEAPPFAAQCTGARKRLSVRLQGE